ncbi:MAG: VanZ family protein [Gemmatimonadota bacterium]
MSQLHARLERLRRPALAAYGLVILLATLTPFTVDTDPDHIRGRLVRALVLSLNRADIIDAARNVVLFAGWGLVWMATSPRGGNWRSVRQATIWGFLLSLSVELGQLGSSNRFASINDVLTNTIGSFLGAICFAAVVYTLYGHRDRKSYFGLPAILLAGSYGVSAFLEALVPLFRDDHGTVHGGVLTRTAIILAGFRWDSIRDIPWEDLFLFAPAGLLAVVALVESGLSHREAALRGGIAGALLCVAAELLHAPLGIPILLGSLLAHIAGVGLGAWAAGRWLGSFSQNVRGVDRPRILLSCYVIVLTLWAWRPFFPEFDPAQYARKLHDPWWIPLALTERWNDFFSVVDVSVPFFLAVPLGALLAVWPLRRVGALRTALPGVYLALVLEAGQLFVIGREPDITDFLVAAAGVAMGWLCLRRAGFQPYGELLRPAPAPAAK